MAVRTNDHYICRHLFGEFANGETWASFDKTSFDVPVHGSGGALKGSLAIRHPVITQVGRILDWAGRIADVILRQRRVSPIDHCDDDDLVCWLQDR